ncbi:glycosyltransferase family 2 protein [Cognatilysobacter lacus]|uniref:Glycosyltransferase family 2 protein n=1 Tax=Cognatilysobacter lacus TaxID=1643323 RepID=A0A5D8Z958_9GAMM|nr:glycosyltransferase family 2 protein [Lysobacter lacus]TZF91187.1 glycosyltransferase family 2 protein [Lysobacter lacus]
MNGFHLPPRGDAQLDLLSVVVPVYGCEGCLEELTERLRRALHTQAVSLEIILVDDASPDRAWDRIREIAARFPDVRGLRLSRNFGQHYAISAGIEAARGDAVVVLDCDLQDPPEEIPALLDVWRTTGADVVMAARSQRQDTAFKRGTSYVFARMLSRLTGIDHDHRTANFGVYSRRAIDAVNSMPESDRCFPLMVKWMGLPTVLAPVRHAERSEGRSSYTLRRLLQLAMNIVLSYSDKPLRLVVRAGILLAAFSVAFAGWSIYRYVAGDIAVAGFTSIIASIWFLGGATVFSIGVTGLYLGRLFNASKGRPAYIVREDTAQP